MFKYYLLNVLINPEIGELCLEGEADAGFPTVISSKLASWMSVEYENCITAKHMEQMIQYMVINPKNVMFFKTSLQRESGEI